MTAGDRSLTARSTLPGFNRTVCATSMAAGLASNAIARRLLGFIIGQLPHQDIGVCHHREPPRTRCRRTALATRRPFPLATSPVRGARLRATAAHRLRDDDPTLGEGRSVSIGTKRGRTQYTETRWRPASAAIAPD